MPITSLLILETKVETSHDHRRKVKYVKNLLSKQTDSMRWLSHRAIDLVEVSTPE